MTSQHSSYKDEGQVELIPGMLRGYRAWRFEAYSMFLMSTGWFHAWSKEQEQPRAECLNKKFYRHSTPPCDSSPNPRCSCGYYASYDPKSYEYHANTLYCPSYAHGTVSAHGRIVLGTGGFRAERIKLDALWGGYDQIELLAKAYGVPWFETRKAMLAEFPPSDVTELLGVPSSAIRISELP